MERQIRKEKKGMSSNYGKLQLRSYILSSPVPSFLLDRKATTKTPASPPSPASGYGYQPFRQGMPLSHSSLSSLLQSCAERNDVRSVRSVYHALMVPSHAPFLRPPEHRGTPCAVAYPSETPPLDENLQMRMSEEQENLRGMEEDVRGESQNVRADRLRGVVMGEHEEIQRGMLDRCEEMRRMGAGDGKKMQNSIVDRREEIGSVMIAVDEEIRGGMEDKDDGVQKVMLFEDGKMLGTSELAYLFIRAFAFCGSLTDAMWIFRNLKEKNAFAWSTVISLHSQANHFEHTLSLYDEMVSCSSLFRPGFHAILAALKACSALVSLQSGKIVHNHAIKDGLESDLFISSALVDMYAKCGGSLQDALNVFEKIKKKDVVSWCAMIGGFANRGHGVEALELYDKMEPEGIEPNKVTVVCLLKACTSIRALDQGKNIHSKAVKIGFEADTFVSSTLIDMYVKCRVIADARWIFDELHDRDLVSWNSLISGYVDLANAKEALHLFNEMQQQGKQPDRITFVATIKAHGLDSNLHECDLVHDDVVKRGLVSDVCIGSCLVDMYAKCGTVESARAVFDRLSKRDVIAWSAMISAYVGHGFGNEALNLYKLMLQSGIEPDRITLMCIFKSCTLLDSSNICKLLHLDALNHGLDSDFMIESMLIGTYFKTGNILDACKIFEMSQVQNVSIWNAMLTGYAESGQNQEVFRLFEQMEEKAIETDEVTYGCMLKASSNGNALDWGNLIHGRIMMRGFDFNIVLANGLIDMYGKCHCLENAFHVFQTLPVSNVITWCALISGFAESGYLHEAMHYYKAMGQNDLAPNEVAFVSILTCCASKGAVSEGMMMHLDAIKQGFDGDECVGNILIDMYTKGGNLNAARVIFDQIPYRTVVTWSSLIGGHVDYGQSEEAVSLLHRMGQEGACGNEITYICILKACSNLSCFHCKQLHTHIITKDLDTVPSIGNTLIGMYASCGDLTMASEVFHKMKVLDAVTWNAIIGGYAEHGDYKSAMVHFERMVFKEYLKPDNITFVNILTACSHAGLLHESCYYFNLSSRFRLVPTIEHCLCLFDVLRRTDRLNDAAAFVDNMPYSPTTAFWIALLSSCAMGKDLELGKRAVVNLIEADGDNIPGLVMMSNLYSAIREHDIVGE